jgi:hypothetical protein
MALGLPEWSSTLISVYHRPPIPMKLSQIMFSPENLFNHPHTFITSLTLKNLLCLYYVSFGTNYFLLFKIFVHFSPKTYYYFPLFFRVFFFKLLKCLSVLSFIFLLTLIEVFITDLGIRITEKTGNNVFSKNYQSFGKKK